MRAPDLLIRFALQPIASIAGLSLLLAASPSARAGEIKAARGGQDLGTLINGGTRCRSGSCKISGGTRAGKNVFHRFSQFDTRGEITGVSIDNSGSQSVFLGVTSPQGSFLDKKLQLKQPGNLYWLSPGGLQMQNGAAFGGVLNLYLSTATGIAFQDRRFDLMNTSADQAERLTTDPLPGRSMFQTDPQSLRALALNRNGDIQISGGLLTIDRSLLIDAQLGDLLITDSAIQGDGATLTARARQTTVQRSVLDVSSADRAGGVISLTSTQGQTLVEQSQLLASGITGGAIDIFGGTVGLGGSSMLQADGFSDAGSIRIGGDYLGQNPDALNAATTEIGPEVLVSANSRREGNGGRIIVWSDGLTTVNGRLEAKGGVASGNGGFIETSGKLGVNIGEHLPDVSAPNGVAGSWLLDPNNVVIANLDASAVDLAACAFSCVFEDPSGTTTTLVNPTQIADRLGGSAGAGSISITADGSITVSDPINISPGTGVGNTFTLDAGTDLFVNQPIDSGGAALDFSAGRLGSGNVLLAGSGGLDSGGANIQLKNLRADSLNDGSIDAGTGTLTLAGNTVVSGQPVTYRAGNFNLTGPVSINNVRLTLEGVGSALPGVAIGSTLNLNGSGSELHLHRDPALSLTGINATFANGSRLTGTGLVSVQGLVGGTPDQLEFQAGSVIAPGSPSSVGVITFGSEPSAGAPLVRFETGSVFEMKISAVPQTSSGDTEAGVPIDATQADKVLFNLSPTFVPDAGPTLKVRLLDPLQPPSPSSAPIFYRFLEHDAGVGINNGTLGNLGVTPNVTLSLLDNIAGTAQVGSLGLLYTGQGSSSSSGSIPGVSTTTPILDPVVVVDPTPVVAPAPVVEPDPVVQQPPVTTQPEPVVAPTVTVDPVLLETEYLIQPPQLISTTDTVPTGYGSVSLLGLPQLGESNNAAIQYDVVLGLSDSPRSIDDFLLDLKAEPVQADAVAPQSAGELSSSSQQVPRQQPLPMERFIQGSPQEAPTRSFDQSPQSLDRPILQVLTSDAAFSALDRAEIGRMQEIQSALPEVRPSSESLSTLTPQAIRETLLLIRNSVRSR